MKAAFHFISAVVCVMVLVSMGLFSGACAQDENAWIDPVQDLGPVGLSPVELAPADMPSYDAGRDAQAAIDNWELYTPSQSYTPAQYSQSSAALNPVQIFGRSDMTAPAYEPANYVEDRYASNAMQENNFPAAAYTGPELTQNTFQENAWKAAAMPYESSASSIADMYHGPLTPVSADMGNTVPDASATGLGSENAVRQPAKVTAQDVGDAIVEGSKRGDVLPMKNGEVLYKVDSASYDTLSRFAKSSPGELAASMSFVNPQDFRTNPEIYQNPENGQLYVVDKSKGEEGVSIYRTNMDQVNAANQANLPMWIYSSGQADGTVVQLYDQNKKPSTLLVGYKDDLYLNANDGGETWLKSGSNDKSSYYKLTTAETAMVTDPAYGAQGKQNIANAREKGDEIMLKSGEAIYRVNSPLYGQMNDFALNSNDPNICAMQFVDANAYKQNPELFHSLDSSQLYVVLREMKEQGYPNYVINWNDRNAVIAWNREHPDQAVSLNREEQPGFPQMTGPGGYENTDRNAKAPNLVVDWSDPEAVRTWNKNHPDDVYAPKHGPTEETMIYRTTDDLISASDRAHLPLGLYTQGQEDGTVVQLYDENRKPSTVLVEYRNGVYVNAEDNNQVYLRSKDGNNYIKVPSYIGNSLLK